MSDLLHEVKTAIALAGQRIERESVTADDSHVLKLEGRDAIVDVYPSGVIVFLETKDGIDYLSEFARTELALLVSEITGEPLPTPLPSEASGEGGV